VLDDRAAALLGSPAAPIVLLRRFTDSLLAPSVAPGNPWIGALLPYSPIHLLLLARVARPLVATSANFSEEPLCIDNAEALSRLREIADLFLVHDRPIARPVDDSVLRPGPTGIPSSCAAPAASHPPRCRCPPPHAPASPCSASAGT
jgi:hydrogenase maturation protein HypF